MPDNEPAQVRRNIRQTQNSNCRCAQTVETQRCKSPPVSFRCWRILFNVSEFLQQSVEFDGKFARRMIRLRVTHCRYRKYVIARTVGKSSVQHFLQRQDDGVVHVSLGFLGRHRNDSTLHVNLLPLEGSDVAQTLASRIKADAYHVGPFSRQDFGQSLSFLDCESAPFGSIGTVDLAGTHPLERIVRKEPVIDRLLESSAQSLHIESDGAGMKKFQLLLHELSCMGFRDCIKRHVLIRSQEVEEVSDCLGITVAGTETGAF